MEEKERRRRRRSREREREMKKWLRVDYGPTHGTPIHKLTESILFMYKNLLECARFGLSNRRRCGEMCGTRINATHKLILYDKCKFIFMYISWPEINEAIIDL